MLIQKRYKTKILSCTTETRDSISKLNSSIQEMISNLSSFVVNNLGKFFNKKYFALENNFAKRHINVSLVITANSVILNVINALIMATTLGYGGYKVIIGALSLGGLVSFNLYSQRFMSPIMQILQFNTDLSSNIVAWEKIVDLLNLPIKVQDKGNKKISSCEDIIFENINFAYEQRPVLTNFNLCSEKNKIHAIVGYSGAGKTTIANLLYRLWDVDEGNIFFGTNKIKDITLESLRKNISIVSQNIFLLNDTIYNNIVLENENISRARLDDILKQADIHKFIESLPNKLDTIVGEDGIKLSGGERQRLSIARALLKNSSTIIFDEATSMLDNKTENNIIRTLSAFRNKTIIIIAHRLSALKMQM